MPNGSKVSEHAEADGPKEPFSGWDDWCALGKAVSSISCSQSWLVMWMS